MWLVHLDFLLEKLPEKIDIIGKNIFLLEQVIYN